MDNSYNNPLKYQQVLASPESHNSAEKRYSTYTKDPSSFVISIQEDVELYKMALKMKNHDLINLFASVLHRETAENQLKFANQVPLLNYSDIDDMIQKQLLDLLTWGPTSAIASVRINPNLSEQHREFAEYQTEIMGYRRDMIPIDRNYEAPHVVISLCHNKERYFAKYFNRTRWCKIQLHEHVKSSFSYLSENKYAVIGNDLWFVESENVLTNVDMFHEKPIRQFFLPHPKPNDFQLCSNGSDIILLSRNKQIAEVLPRPFNHEPFEVTDWYQLRPYEYKTIFANEDLTIYDISTRDLCKNIKICFRDSIDSLFELCDKGICEYNIVNHEQMFKKTLSTNGHLRFRIPRDRRENCTYVLIETQNIVNFLNMFVTDSSVKSRKRKICNQSLVENNFFDENVSFDTLSIF